MGLSLLLDMAADGHGDRIALGTQADGITFERMAAVAAGGAEVIKSHSPENVVFIGRNGPAFPLVLLAAALAGIPFAPLNYRLGTKRIVELVDELGDPLVIAESDYAGFAADRHRVVLTEAFIAQASATPGGHAVWVDDSDPAVLLFTSGTTSRPKAVVLHHENLVSYILSTVELGGADADEAALVAVPPYHIAAVGSVLSNLYSGRRVVYLPDFDAATWLRLVRDEHITTAMLVPTMLARVVDLLGQEVANVPWLRLISYGGSRMPLPVLEHALRVFPDTGFVNAYGLTETSSTIALLGPEGHREALASQDPVVRARLGSVGKPVPGIEIEVRDDGGQQVGPGESGALWVRGPQVSGDYRGQASALDRAGWFHTRDRAHLDSDGYLFIEGRLDDMIIRGGENIGPAEIEDVIVRHPAVKEVAVVGKPDDEWGERIIAVVVREPGVDVTVDELRAYVRARLRGSRTPDEVVWAAELPHTATGKLVRRDLMRQLSHEGPSDSNQEPRHGAHAGPSTA